MILDRKSTIILVNSKNYSMIFLFNRKVQKPVCCINFRILVNIFINLMLLIIR